MSKGKSRTVGNTGESSVIRLLLLGDSAVGKSSLLLRFCEGRFENNFVITIGVDFKTKSMNLEGKQYKVQVWDTAGQERFRTITPAYYRNASGVQIIFDVTNRKSFESMSFLYMYNPLFTLDVEYWIRNLDEHGAPGVFKQLIGNKCDLEHKRKVTSAEAQALADKHNMSYIETSAKEDFGVDASFRKLGEQIARKLGSAGGSTAVSLNPKETHRSKCCQG